MKEDKKSSLDDFFKKDTSTTIDMKSKLGLKDERTFGTKVRDFF
jgi:hypothetical protein